jgi:DNA-binding NarL/FixJ family response regulator
MTKERKKRIAVVDDHPLVRQGLAKWIENQGDMVVCCEAEDTADALKAITESKPDLAIIDISLRDSNGIELIEDLNTRMGKKLPMLVLSMHDESFYAERALRAGARGYISKSAGPKTVITAIRRILAGEIYLSQRMASRMVAKFVDGKAKKETGSPEDRLTNRELQVFEMIGRGVRTRDIATQLHLSVKTVESHRENIKRKLQLKSATELLQHAIQWVLVERSA